MSAAALDQARVQDLPICLPGRACVDQSPVAAPLMGLTSALTPASPVIAAVCFAIVAAALVLAGLGLRRQWRDRRVSGPLAGSVGALLLIGACLRWTVGVRLSLVSSIYRGADGRPSAPVPPTLVGAWPAVMIAGGAMSAVAALALLVMLCLAAAPGRRDRIPTG